MFAAGTLDLEHGTYVVYVASLSSTPPFDADVHPSCKPQRAGLIAEETPTNAPAEYANFADVFSLTLGSTNGYRTGQCQRIHQTIQVTRRRSKISWEKFDSSRRLFVG